MKISFINRSNESGKLILIFPGWSCGNEFYAGFRFSDWDVAVVDDYADFHLDSSALAEYSTIYLFAWSLGVYMAEKAEIANYITGAVALNGTLLPADDLYGIPIDIYKKTADNLSPRNIQKFRRRMAGNADVYKKLFIKDITQEETSILKKILLNILSDQGSAIHPSLPWTKVFLSENDSIFPFSNMKNHWGKVAGSLNCEIITLNEGHYVPLDRIVKYCIPRIDKVSHRFSRAASTYDRRAVAQRKLAVSLRKHLSDISIMHGGVILEIGPGTGLFTQEIINEFHPSEIDFVDISDTRPDAAGLTSAFFQRDAEQWIASCTKSYDAILSSATVQWFVNLQLFIKNCSFRLKADGVLGFSTFLPGNLDELSALRPSPIHYHTEEEIKQWMEPWFEKIECSSFDIVVSFDSARELFSHLRETGVGGSAPAGKLPLSALRRLTSLTYRCACFSGILKRRPFSI